jgi:hypothetical protein
MNRKKFLSSISAGIAAAMLPFGFKLKLSAPNKPRYYSIDTLERWVKNVPEPKVCDFWFQTGRRRMIHKELMDTFEPQWEKVTCKNEDQRND